MAHVRFVLAGGPVQVYRARNPEKSPLWQCAHRHYDEFEAAYPEGYQPRYGVLRRIILEAVLNSSTPNLQLPHPAKQPT